MTPALVHPETASTAQHIVSNGQQCPWYMVSGRHAGPQPLGRVYGANYCDDSAGCPLRHAGEPPPCIHVVRPDDASAVVSHHLKLCYKAEKQRMGKSPNSRAAHAQTKSNQIHGCLLPLLLCGFPWCRVQCVQEMCCSGVRPCFLQLSTGSTYHLQCLLLGQWWCVWGWPEPVKGWCAT
jgi:hypothetical protein